MIQQVLDQITTKSRRKILENLKTNYKIDSEIAEEIYDESLIHAKNLLQQETKNLATLSLMRLDEIFEKSMELGTAQGYNVARQTIALQMELFHVEDKESKVVEITRNWTWNKIEKSGTE